MKYLNTIFNFNLVLAFIVLSFVSCSKDSDDPDSSEITLTTSNFSITMDENPANGQVIGTVSGTTNEGSVTFSITEQNPAGAFSIDAASGELKVTDETLFDFETNPIITGTVKVSSGTVSKNASITIILNDLAEENVYDGHVFLKSQQEVNDFGAINYTRIKGSLVIGYLEEPDMSAIYDLSPLNSLKKIDYSLSISKNSDLSTTEGLNISEIGEQLAIAHNPSLISIVGLNKVTTLGNGLFIEDNNVLSNFTGLTQLTNIQSLDIFGCPLMQNIDWLNNVTHIEGYISISSCNSITNIDGLRNLISTSSTEYNEIFIRNNQKLENLNGLQNLNATLNGLIIDNNPSLFNLNGLNNLDVVHGLLVADNDLLRNLQGLEKITAIENGIIIRNNDALINLQGLDNLAYNNGTISINNNDQLTSLNGLNNLTNIWSVVADFNPNLIDFCALKNVLTIDSLSSFTSISNAYNPTKQDIVDGNCSL